MLSCLGLVPYGFDVFEDDEVMYGINYEKLYAILAALSILVFFALACLSVFRYTGRCVLDFAIMRNAEKIRESKKKKKSMERYREYEKEEMCELEEEGGE